MEPHLLEFWGASSAAAAILALALGVEIRTFGSRWLDGRRSKRFRHATAAFFALVGVFLLVAFMLPLAVLTADNPGLLLVHIESLLLGVSAGVVVFAPVMFAIEDYLKPPTDDVDA